MPSITSYTPYETLAFVQSLARHGTDALAFEDIAASLKSNQLIQEDEKYDHSRLTAEALRTLYEDLVQEEGQNGVQKVNGDVAITATNPRKRKLSPSPGLTNGTEIGDEELVHTLVDKLYTRFREQVIRDIRRGEEEYVRIQNDIKALEEKIEADQSSAEVVSSIKDAVVSQQPALTDAAQHTSPAVRTSLPQSAPSQTASIHDLSYSDPTTRTVSPQIHVERKPIKEPAPVRAQIVPNRVQPSPSPAAQGLNLQTLPAESNQSRQQSKPVPPPAGLPQSQSSPGAFHRQLPPPSPQRPNYGPIASPHGYPQGSHMLPPLPGMSPQIPSNIDFSAQKRPASTPGQGRGSPVSIPPQPPYPGYPLYQQPPWPATYHSQPQYGRPPPYPPQQYYVPPPGAHPPPYQTPHHSPYQMYPQPGPVPYPGQPPPPQGWYPRPGQPYFAYPSSQSSTPIAQGQSRPSLGRNPSSSTPWKRQRDAMSGGRLRSPVRPDRAVSPLSNRGSPTPESDAKHQIKELVGQSPLEDNTESVSLPRISRGSRAGSQSAQRRHSRSQSVASQKSETPSIRPLSTRRARKSEADAHNTPAPASSDVEQTQTSSGKKGRGRVDNLTPKVEASRSATTSTALKRKRSIIRDNSVTPSIQSPAKFITRAASSTHDTSLVVVSRNFAKTAQLLINEIISHKLGGIFAKPLSERDAPGYRDLVLRPQDLKSIKSAISKGGRAAQIAIDAFESEADEPDDTVTQSKTTNSASTSQQRLIGNGMYLVTKSEELTPPKGIVNSSQLEMELVRMFANAVMFNPLSEAERGFGRNLRLRKNGGDISTTRRPTTRLESKKDQRKSDIEKDEDSSETERDENDEDTDMQDPSTASDETSEEEGGIISDAREMFEDVVVAVGKYRDLEIERIGGGNFQAAIGSGSEEHKPSSATQFSTSELRRDSVSSALNEEDLTGPVTAQIASTTAVTGMGSATGNRTGTPSTSGPGRKRRKIAD